MGSKLRRLRLVKRSGTSRVALHDFTSVNIGGAGSLGGQGTGLVDRGIDVLTGTCHVPVIDRGHDRHVGEVAANVPGIAAARRDGRCIGDVLRIITTARHLPPGSQLQQV